MSKLKKPMQPFPPQDPFRWISSNQNIKSQEKIYLGHLIIDRIYTWSTRKEGEISMKESEMTDKDHESYHEWKDYDYESFEFEDKNFSLQDLIDMVPTHLSPKDLIFKADLDNISSDRNREPVVGNVHLVYTKYKDQAEVDATNKALKDQYDADYAEYEKEFEHWKNVAMPAYEEALKQEEIRDLENRLKDLKNGK